MPAKKQEEEADRGPSPKTLLLAPLLLGPGSSRIEKSAADGAKGNVRVGSQKAASSSAASSVSSGKVSRRPLIGPGSCRPRWWRMVEEEEEEEEEEDDDDTTTADGREDAESQVLSGKPTPCSASSSSSVPSTRDSLLQCESFRGGSMAVARDASDLAANWPYANLFWRMQDSHCSGASSLSSEAALNIGHGKRLPADQVRRRLLTCVQLLKELQAENGSLWSELAEAQESSEAAMTEAKHLRQENDALRSLCRELQGGRDVDSPLLPLAEPNVREHEKQESSDSSLADAHKASCSTRNMEKDERAAATEEQQTQEESKASPAALDAKETVDKEVQAASPRSAPQDALADLKAQLHKAQVALVSIVPELERRIAERDASLKEARSAISRLEEELRQARSERSKDKPASVKHAESGP